MCDHPPLTIFFCHPIAGLDMDPIPDDPTGPCQGSACRGPRALPEEPLDVILSPELDKMVADGKAAMLNSDCLPDVLLNR